MRPVLSVSSSFKFHAVFDISGFSFFQFSVFSVFICQFSVLTHNTINNQNNKREDQINESQSVRVRSKISLFIHFSLSLFMHSFIHSFLTINNAIYMLPFNSIFQYFNSMFLNDSGAARRHWPRASHCRDSAPCRHHPQRAPS